jgi:hypothetical protein
MKNKDLIKILEQLDPSNEICIELQDVNSQISISSSYAIGTTINACNELVLTVDVEK